GHQALQVLEEQGFELLVSDIQMPNMDGHSLLKQVKETYPDLPVMLMTAYGSIQQAVDAMRDGAVDYMVKPFEAEVLVNMVSRYAGQPDQQGSDMVAEDETSKNMLKVANRVAASDATVMITGESGVGKEVLAQYIHLHSNRKDQPFIAINCAAIPENMLEATLFGYEKGAYTGAYKACPGKFEQAQNGTLLLDEITEMDLGLQAKLLRVLQEREVERLGGNKTIPLDVRVVATSNRNISEYVGEGKFREDLFYRLNVFPISIPPLNQRKNDILPLVHRITEKQCKQMNTAIPAITAEAERKLVAHHWPGNVRELDNVIQRALVLHQGDAIDKDDIYFENAVVESITNISQQPDRLLDEDISSQCSEPEIAPETLNDEMKQKEWKVILSTIASVQGSRKQAAEKLGISQRTLRYKLAKMRDAGISIPGRSAEVI
ncbi:MAG: sigma-54 dependent transcriptional regulator, partial [Thioalkalispiraceae bacterium]